MFWRKVAAYSLPGVTLLVLAVAPAHSQRIEDGELEFLRKARPTRDLRVGLFKGATPAEANNKEHQEAAEIAAKEVTYPLVWYQDAALRPEPRETREERDRRLSKLNTLVEEFDSRLGQMTRFSDRTTVMQQMYCREIMRCVPEVVQKGKPVAGVNAARMLALITERRMQRGVLDPQKEWAAAVLPRLGEGNADRLAEVGLALLADPKATAGVQYYVLRSLANLLALPAQSPPLLKTELRDKVIARAIPLVEKKVAYPKATPRQVVEGYKMVRMQAVRIVAAGRTPLLADKTTPPIVLLARVAAADAGIVPTPRIEERLEAAIGLAEMGAAAAKLPDVQMDYAAAQIARYIIDFGVQANANLDSKPTVRLRPWRIDAARMIEALDVLRTDVKSPYVQDVVRQALPVLNALEQNQPSQPNDLADWLSRNAPPAASLLKSDPASVVKPAGGAAAVEEPEPKDDN